MPTGSAGKRFLSGIGAVTGLAIAALGCKSQPRSAPAVDAAAAAAAVATGTAVVTVDAGRALPPLRLAEFAPQSMLHVPAHQVPRARFPVVDFHQHVNDKFEPDGKLGFPPAELIKLMDAANVRTIVVLTGPSGATLGRLVDGLVKPFPGRFVVFTQVDWSRIDEPDFGARAAAQLRQDVGHGARGLKVLKTLGLYQRHKNGQLVAVDDPRIDPIWREAGRLGIPVAIHTGDPEAFFHPQDGKNERYEELWVNPDWSFAGPGFPALEALLAARDRVIARHPGTTFVALHVGGWPGKPRLCLGPAWPLSQRLCRAGRAAGRAGAAAAPDPAAVSRTSRSHPVRDRLLA